MVAHCEGAEALLARLGTDGRAGLTQAEARRRLEENGPNELRQEKRPSRLLRLLGQLRDPMTLVLLAAAGLSLWAGGGRDWLDSAIILVIVVVNAAISISQEDHAQKALDALKELSAPTALVRRDGALCRVGCRELVVGDVVYISAGDQIGADGRLLQSAELRVDESAMTGESVSVDKEPADDLSPETPLAERRNMVLAGTMAVAGKGVMVVTATGMDTEMGRVASLLDASQRRPTPLQRRMGEVSRTLSFVCLCVCAVMFGVGLLQGKGILEMLMTAVSLAVAAIPEGLSAVVTIVLALGVARLARRGAIVTKLPAVETLGCAGVICSDKTGTLTRNRMEVVRRWSADPETEVQAAQAFALCNDAAWSDGQALGDPTEAALLEMARRMGISRDALERREPRVGELAFDARRKRMTTLHRRDRGYVAYVKGAPDLLLERCDKIMTAQGPVPLTPTRRRQVERQYLQMGKDALRVLAAARKELDALPREPAAERIERGLTFLGLAGMMDPPRSGVKEAVAQCHRAGIRPVMITGDHRSTALAVARELNILRPGDTSVTGAELDFMSQEELEALVERVSVYARVTPEHKMRIVRAWQERGQTVAMTGDGVNDAPALRQADIGCAMGKSGTQVAKSCAHLILTDDDFSTIVAAVDQGRGIYANIKKAVHYLLSCNIGEIMTLFVATALNLAQMPLVPVQLLWLNLVTDSLPALALGMEAPEPGTMDRPPRSAAEGLFDRRFSLRLLWQGGMVGGLTLAGYCLGRYVLVGQADPGAVANTMAFATLTLCQLFHAFNVRSEDQSIFALGAFSNRAMDRAFLIGLAMQLSVLLFPPLMGIFSTVWMTPLQWMTVAALAVAPVAICEIAKALGRAS